jgi:quercetin dioxygenase-like cupin family protein
MRRTDFFGRAGTSAAMAIIAMSGLTPALASPGSQVTPTTYSTSTLSESVEGNHDRIKFQTKDPTVVRVQKLEFAPGGYTGFHHHPGIVIVSIASGSLNLVDGSDCSVETKATGTVFVETSDHAHNAIAPNGATVYVTYITPAAEPPIFRMEEPVPFCASSL